MFKTWICGHQLWWVQAQRPLQFQGVRISPEHEAFETCTYCHALWWSRPLQFQCVCISWAHMPLKHCIFVQHMWQVLALVQYSTGMWSYGIGPSMHSYGRLLLSYTSASFCFCNFPFLLQHQERRGFRFLCASPKDSWLKLAVI